MVGASSLRCLERYIDTDGRSLAKQSLSTLTSLSIYYGMIAVSPDPARRIPADTAIIRGHKMIQSAVLCKRLMRRPERHELQRTRRVLLASITLNTTGSAPGTMIGRHDCAQLVRARGPSSSCKIEWLVA